MLEKKSPCKLLICKGLFWWAVQGSNLRPLPCEAK